MFFLSQHLATILSKSVLKAQNNSSYLLMRADVSMSVENEICLSLQEKQSLKIWVWSWIEGASFIVLRTLDFAKMELTRSSDESSSLLPFLFLQSKWIVASRIF